MTAPAMICIDFGTSSIRAAARYSAKDDAVPLRLGDAFGSSIDSASIPSACWVSADRTTMSFGEIALRNGLTSELRGELVLSPKTWMTEGTAKSLDEIAIAGTNLTKRHLLSGLMAQVWSALSKDLGTPVSSLQRSKIRIAHPAWPDARKGRLRAALYEILLEGAQLSGSTDGPIGLGEFLKAYKTAEDTPKPDVDIEEPVAAAVFAYGMRPDSREICLVVDVGAGTTDMAAFVAMDPGYDMHRKLYFAAPTRSVPKAGDIVDEAVVRALVKEGGAKLDQIARSDIKNRRRQLKESLFKNGYVVYGDSKVTIDEVIAAKPIRDMSRDIANELSGLFSDARIRLKVFRETGNRPDRVEVAFVGGGAQLKFLHEVVSDVIKQKLGLRVKILPRMAGSKNLPASAERLAVALGGVTSKGDWPETRMRDPEFWRGLPV